MPKFREYIEQLIAHVNANVSVREYRTQSRDTEVIGSVLKNHRESGRGSSCFTADRRDSGSPAKKGA